MLLLWNLLLGLLWPLLYFYRPFRGEIPQRLGGDLPHWESGQTTFLINAVSAGEVVAIAPFIRELKRRLPACRIALLTTTDSGQAMARGKLADAIDLLAYFPLADLSWVSRRYLDRLAPDLYITTESELWPNIQGQCRARGIPVVSLNARIYLHNKRGLRGRLVRHLYALCDLIVCQSEQQRANFLTFGVPATKLTVSGNTKFDFTLPEWTAEQLTAWQTKWGLAPETPVVVAGSTHPGEEELMLDTLLKLRASTDFELPPRLIVAPRHIERAAAVVELARRQGLSALTLTEAEAAPEGLPAWAVLVVDRYGVLVDFYRLANVVIMGGTFSPKVGGHNILEATALGKPVVVGLVTFSITPQLELLTANNAVVQVSQSIDGSPRAESKAIAAMRLRQLLLAVDRLLAVPHEAAAIGARAMAATLASQGAAARATDAVVALLPRAAAG